MKNCVFCKIISKEIPSSPVLENKEFLAINDINPKAPVHILIIMKEHLPSVREASFEKSGKMVELANEIAKDQGLRGYKLIFNVGRAGGQIIDHLHLHLVGGWGEAPKEIEI